MDVCNSWYVRRLDLEGHLGSWFLVSGHCPYEVVRSVPVPMHNPRAVLAVANRHMRVVGIYYVWGGRWRLELYDEELYETLGRTGSNPCS